MNNSVYGLLYVSDGDENDLALVTDLTGKKFNSISNHQDGIIASCTDGHYQLKSNVQIERCSLQDFLNVSGGKTFFAGVENSTNSIYSWGNGDIGELGQGACKSSISEPTIIKYNAKFVHVSCGSSFAVALDEKGNAYSWGSNFERQLGLYTKPVSRMHLPNCVIEDMTFLPRLIPFSLSFPISKIACGPDFAACLTKGGDLYMWGAGQCGQLGTGRCTRQETITKVPLGDNISGVADVACGVGHTLAVTQTGLLYRWGLNKCGQLGLGDTNTRYTPVCSYKEDHELLAGPPHCFTKVFADGHSSAAIDSDGALCTWGSNDHNRLMHPLTASNSILATATQTSADSLSHLNPFLFSGKVPKRVIRFETAPRIVASEKLIGCRVEAFAFSSCSSAALVHTTVTKVFPDSGPKRAFSKLQVFGYGLWDSPHIVLKFTCKTYSAYNPPRSCAGRLEASQSLSGVGVIVCKPPKFAEVGDYMVSVSMDGANFLPQQLEISVYQDVTVLSQAPALVDLREKGETLPISLTVKGMPTVPNHTGSAPECFVRLSFCEVDGSSDGDKVSRKAYGLKTPQQPVAALEVVVAGRMQPIEEGADDATQTVVCDQVDLTSLREAGRNVLYDMRCQISRNNQDFSVGGGTSSLFHSFSPMSVDPCCYVISSLERHLAAHPADSATSSSAFDREVVVWGESMFPSGRLPEGAAVEVHLQPEVAGRTAAAEEEATEAGEAEPLVLPVVCETATRMKFTLTLSVLTQLLGALSSQPKDELLVLMSFHLRESGEDAAAEEKVTSLSPAALRYFVCRDAEMKISPSSCKRALLAEGPLLISVSRRDGSFFSFCSVNAQVRVHLSPTEGETKSFLLRPDAVAMVPVIDASLPEDETPPSFQVQVQLLSLDCYEEVQQWGVDSSAISSVHLSLSLDGLSEPGDSAMDKLCFYTSLGAYSLTAAAPKGGFVAGASISLTLQEYVRPGLDVKVRLRGVNEVNAIQVAATLVETAIAGNTAACVQFALPGEASKLDVIMSGKEKLLFVDVSADGGVSFDKADTAMLQVK